jgi:hypothetical protein
MKSFRIVLTCVAWLMCLSHAQAQIIHVYSPPVVPVVPSVPSVTYYAPPVVVPQAPVVNYSYYPPTTVNYSYYPGTVAYSAPVVAAPTVVYSAPAVAPGYYTTRTYTGYGIFRPRGTYSETYYTPYWR